MRIAFNLGSRRFSAHWLPTVLVLLVVPVMLSLAHWQYDRARQKQALNDQMERHWEQSASELYDWSRAAQSGWQFRRVVLRGQFDSGQQFLLDNRLHEQRAGYAVLTPFRHESGQTVLVRRGWVPRGAQRDQLPDVSVDGSTPDGAERVIEGRVYQPGDAFKLGEMSYEDGWPLRVQYIDYAAMSRALASELEPWLLVLEPEDRAAYEDDWVPVVDGPEQNYSYMGQWLAMAIAVIVLYLILNLRRRNGDE
ncbi:MAG: SURF1 family protein [Pseudomonadota bacterium]